MISPMLHKCNSMWRLFVSEWFWDYIVLALGWGGDTLTLFERGNESLFAWNIAWDSAAELLNFS